MAEGGSEVDAAAAAGGPDGGGLGDGGGVWRATPGSVKLRLHTSTTRLLSCFSGRLCTSAKQAIEWLRRCAGDCTWL